jgi:uncharacterized protein YutE (UPF0331/DUF86 family)
MNEMQFLTASATLTALSFAIFAFLFPKWFEPTKDKRKAVRMIDIPDSVDKDSGFTLRYVLDSLTVYYTSAVTLLVGLHFTVVSIDIINHYQGFRPWIYVDIAAAFKGGVIALGVLLILMFFMPPLSLGFGLLFGKLIPVLMRAYAEIALGRKGAQEVTSELLTEAKRANKSGQYAKAILNSSAAIEYELRRKFDVTEPYSFSTLIYKLAESGIPAMTIEKLRKMVEIRNKVAHPSHGVEFTSEDAKYVLALTNDILQTISKEDLSLVYDTLKYQ